MHRTSLFLALVAASLSPAALAQDRLDPTMDLHSQPSRIAPRATGNSAIPPGQGSHLVWGSSQLGVTWLPAQAFSGKANAENPDLDYVSFAYYNSPGATGRRQYYAYLDLDPGLNVSHLACFYNDQSATEDITFSWWEYDLEASTGNTVQTQISPSTSSSGTPGKTWLTLSAGSGGRTMRKYTLANDHVIQDQVIVNVGANTSFTGCMAYWHRQVAPGPATATFNDVPTSSPFFKFVEALNESGVTAGCGNGNFCPNAPVTRAQMAVYLAEALGMGYPH